jgi:hypothetical protein
MRFVPIVTKTAQVSCWPRSLSTSTVQEFGIKTIGTVSGMRSGIFLSWYVSPYLHSNLLLKISRRH